MQCLKVITAIVSLVVKGNLAKHQKVLKHYETDCSNTIFACFFLFFLIIDLYFLIPAVPMQICFADADLTIPTGIPANEANAGI